LDEIFDNNMDGLLGLGIRLINQCG
jgi:hypothetical protein